MKKFANCGFLIIFVSCKIAVCSGMLCLPASKKSNANFAPIIMLTGTGSWKRGCAKGILSGRLHSSLSKGKDGNASEIFLIINNSKSKLCLTNRKWYRLLDWLLTVDSVGETCLTFSYFSKRNKVCCFWHFRHVLKWQSALAWPERRQFKHKDVCEASFMRFFGDSCRNCENLNTPCSPLHIGQLCWGYGVFAELLCLVWECDRDATNVRDWFELWPVSD